MFEPTYALHSHIAHVTGTPLVQGKRRPDFTVDVGAAVSLIEKEAPSIVFLCSPNNPTGTAEDEGTVSAVIASSPGLTVVDEAYGQFSSWSALELVREDVPLVVVRTYSKTWSMAALRLGYLIGPSEVVNVLDRVALPYHLDALKQAAGRLALRFCSQMEQRVALIVAERERVAAELSKMAVKVWPSQANFVLWRPLRHSGAEVWEGLVRRSVLVRDTSSWPGLEGCLRTIYRYQGRKRQVPLGCCGGARMSEGSQVTRERNTKETEIWLKLAVDGSGQVEVATGLPFFDHMISQLGRHAGFDLELKAAGDLVVDAHHTVEDVGIALEGGVLHDAASATRRGVRRFASIAVPLDEALIEVALDLSGRPFLVYEVDPGAGGEAYPLGDPPFDPQLAEEFWRAFCTSSAVTLHIRMRSGRNSHHILEACFKGVARALRDAVRVEGAGVPSTKGVLG